jgi:hypothetical protein
VVRGEIVPGIIFTGASGVGKTTLAQWAAGTFGRRFVASVTAAVYADFGITYDEASRDPGTLLRVQQAIYDRTADRLAAECTRPGRGFVSDRGADVLAYTSILCPTAFQAVGVPGLIDDLMRRPDVVVFYVRPCREVLAEARTDDRGRRNVFLSDEWVYRVDGIIGYRLQANQVPHTEVTGPGLLERLDAVRATMAAAGCAAAV